MTRHRPLLTILAFLCASLLIPIFACAADNSLDRMGEISKRIEELSKQVQACGSDNECICRIFAEMQALWDEYSKLAKSASPGSASLPGAITPGATTPSEVICPSCDRHFRPGWSCLPVKMYVTDRMVQKGYAQTGGPAKWNVVWDMDFAYTADGSGILEYTKDFREFRMLVMARRADHRVTQFSWKKDISDQKEKKWVSGPQGTVRVIDPCSLHIVYPPEPEPAPRPDFHYRFSPMEVRCDGDNWVSGEAGTTLPYTGSPPFEMTPETVKEMVQSGQFAKTFAWRIKTGVSGGDPSYDDHNLTIRLEVGTPSPQVEPGVLAVSPGDGFSCNCDRAKGTYTPESKTYTLTNTGKETINYTVSKIAAWLDLSDTSGSLAPKQSAKVTVSINTAKAKTLTEDVYKDTIKFTNTTNGKGNTTRPAELTIGEEQKWRVFLTGYEIDEMNPYWKITDKVRGAVRFNYKLRGEFTILKKKGKWQYKEGTITIADVGLANLYEPLEVWMVKPFKCVNCDQVSSLTSTPLAGSIDGNTVKLYWGNVKPQLTVDAKITCPCTPMPSCAEWTKRLYVSEQFFDRVNYVPLPLQNGWAKNFPIVSPQKLRWVNFDYTMQRLK